MVRLKCLFFFASTKMDPGGPVLERGRNQKQNKFDTPFNRLMYGHDTEPHQTFENRPNANICEDSTQSSRVPHDILGRSNHIWRTSHPHDFYGGFHKSMDPRTYFGQSLRLVMSTATASHLLRVHKQIRSTRTAHTSPDDGTASTASTSATVSRPLQQRNPLLPRHRST